MFIYHINKFFFMFFLIFFQYAFSLPFLCSFYSVPFSFSLLCSPIHCSPSSCLSCDTSTLFFWWTIFSCIAKYLVLSLTLTLALLFALLHIYFVLALQLVYILVECMLFSSSPVFYASFCLKTYLLSNFRL